MSRIADGQRGLILGDSRTPFVGSGLRVNGLFEAFPPSSYTEGKAYELKGIGDVALKRLSR